MAAIIRRHPRKIAAGIVLVAAFYGAAEDILPNPFRTPGVRNIEKRYSSGGGAPNHQPATSSPRGQPDKIEGNLVTHKGIGTPYHKEKYQEQRPNSSEFDKAWNKAHYNTEKGK